MALGVLRTCTLILTHECNLNCKYCFARFKDNVRMPLETALQCVRKEIAYSIGHGYRELLVTFMGGEPFLNFDVMRGVVDWLCNHKRTGLKIYIFATTNGTVLTSEMKSWLVTRRDVFKVSVSYDGTPPMQVLNRTSYPVDLDFFLSEFPAQVVHMTVSRETVGRLGEGVAWLLEKKARCSLTLAYGQKWTDEDAGVYEQQLRELAALFGDLYCSEEPIPQLTMPLSRIGTEPLQINWKVGLHKVSYDVDGRRYPSYILAPYVSGIKKSMPMADDEFQWQRNVSTVDSFCEGCPLYNVCPTCPEFNYLYNGQFNLKDHSICKMVQAQVKVALEFQCLSHWKRQKIERK